MGVTPRVLTATFEHPHTTDHILLPGWSSVLHHRGAWSHPGSEGEQEATCGARLPAHSGEVVNGWRGLTASDLGDPDGVSGGY